MPHINIGACACSPQPSDIPTHTSLAQNSETRVFDVRSPSTSKLKRSGFTVLIHELGVLNVVSYIDHPNHQSLPIFARTNPGPAHA